MYSDFCASGIKKKDEEQVKIQDMYLCFKNEENIVSIIVCVFVLFYVKKGKGK